MSEKIKFIDLFAGLGGLRIGLESAASELGLQAECVFTSEIKPHAILAYEHNFPGDVITGDITQVSAAAIPDFDVLLAGFPCQPFSSAGKGRGFTDTRGTLFFDIERILEAKKPKSFILENVEGLVTHDRVDSSTPTGRTLDTILMKLTGLGYKVTWRVFDSSLHGLAQRRKRIYIVGSLQQEINLDGFSQTFTPLKTVLDDSSAGPDLTVTSPIVEKLLKFKPINELAGMQVRDKRGGKNNIHSWDIGLKGAVSDYQRELLETLLLQRRRKSWAEKKNIPWSDGMPLTAEEIHSVAPPNSKSGRVPNLEELERDLKALKAMGYLSFESPKKAPHSPAGYNIVAGKLSFAISYILDPEAVTPTLVATDVTRLAIPFNGSGFRRLSVREGLRLFGFPDSYVIPGTIDYTKAFDLLGNSVTLNVVTMVSGRVLSTH